jgi:hypothetical protein
VSPCSAELFLGEFQRFWSQGTPFHDVFIFKSSRSLTKLGPSLY